jgi:hypothetical protein
VDLTHPYAVTVSLGAFHYPPFVWFFAPLRLLSFDVGYPVWTAVGAAAITWLTGRWALAWLLFPPVTSELYHGNVHLLLAVALVLGFRFAPGWAFVGLAKVSTGVIALWPVLRRDRRALGLLAATVATVCVPSILLAPGLWSEWVAHLLARNAEPNHWGTEIGIPLGLRVLGAIVLLVWAARSDRRWLTAPAMALAMPGPLGPQPRHPGGHPEAAPRRVGRRHRTYPASGRPR